MKSICISFDYDNDRNYRYLLSAWDKNQQFKFSMNDKTPSEIDSNDYSRIKAVLSTKIKQSDCLFVIVGAKTDSSHPKAKEIGEKNWQVWEINKAKEFGKKIVAVKIEYSNSSPDALKNCGVIWALSFTQENVVAALNKV